jgi:hypothetical protein
VEYQQLHYSHRIQALLLVTLEPPPPLLRRKIGQEGSFEATGLHETMPESIPREVFHSPEESIVSDLKTKGFKPSNSMIIDLSMSLRI